MEVKVDCGSKCFPIELRLWVPLEGATRRKFDARGLRPFDFLGCWL